MKNITNIQKTCCYCHIPVIYTKRKCGQEQTINIGVTDIENKKYMCYDCYNLHYHLSITDCYFTNGQKFGIDDVKRIKLRIHCSEVFFFNVYADTAYERKARGWGSPNEFSFKIELSKFNVTVDSLKKVMTANLNRVKVPERKLLVTNEHFVMYVFTCIKETFRKIDKVLAYEYGL